MPFLMIDNIINVWDTELTHKKLIVVELIKRQGKRMRVKGKGLICSFMLAALIIIAAGCGNSEEKDSKPSKDETGITDVSEENTFDNNGESSSDNGNGEPESSDSSEESTEIVLGYKFDVSSNWKLAYADTDYLYYYMMDTSDTYDSNVVLSVTSDKSLASAELSELEKSLRKQYGDKIHIEKGTTKENGEKMLYLEMEQMNGDIKSRIGQYIVVGKKKAVIFSVYSEEGKFETAKKYTGYVVNTISFDK